VQNLKNLKTKHSLKNNKLFLDEWLRSEGFSKLRKTKSSSYNLLNSTQAEKLNDQTAYKNFDLVVVAETARNSSNQLTFN